MRALELLGLLNLSASGPLFFYSLFPVKQPQSGLVGQGEYISPLRILVDLVNQFHNFIAKHLNNLRLTLHCWMNTYRMSVIGLS